MSRPNRHVGWPLVSPGGGRAGHLCCKQRRECFDKRDAFWPLPSRARSPYRAVIRAIPRGTSQSAGAVEFFTRVRVPEQGWGHGRLMGWCARERFY